MYPQKTNQLLLKSRKLPVTKYDQQGHFVDSTKTRLEKANPESESNQWVRMKKGRLTVSRARTFNQRRLAFRAQTFNQRRLPFRARTFNQRRLPAMNRIFWTGKRSEETSDSSEGSGKRNDEMSENFDLGSSRSPEWGPSKRQDSVVKLVQNKKKHQCYYNPIGCY